MFLIFVFFFYVEGGRGVPNQLRGDTAQVLNRLRGDTTAHVQKQLRRPENVIIKHTPKRNLRQVQKAKSIQVMKVTWM